MKKTKSLIYINIKPFFSFKLLFYFTFIIFGKSFAQTWQSIGPFGGDRHFVYQDPHNHNTFYTGGIGFVHRTTDDGENWISLTDNPTLGQLGVEAVIVSYSDSNKILTNSKKGMFLSTDRGQTWNLFDKGLLSEKKATTFVSFHSNPNYVFAGIGVKDAAKISQGGVYFSDDFGQTWQSMNTGLGLTKTTRIYSSNTDDLYAATLGAGLFKFDTTSQSWSALGSFDDSVTSIKVDPTNDSILIAGTYSNWLFRSQDKGLTWSQLAKPSQLSNGELPATCWDIEFDPQNTQVIYTRLYSGQEIPWYQNKEAASTTKGSFYSIDGGSSWEKLSGGSFTDMLVDGFSPLTSDSLPVRSSRIIRTGGGAGNIKISNDGGVSFQIKNKGIATVLVNRVTVDKYGRVFMGAEAGVALLRNVQGIQSQWQFLNISPTSERIGYNWQMVVAPEDSSLAFFSKGEFSHFSNTGKGIYKYNIDSNVEGSVLPSTKHTGFMYITTGNTSDTLYAASHSSGVWMSTDQGNSWTKYEAGLNEKMVQTLYVSKTTRLPLYCVTRLDSIRWSKSVPPDRGGFYKWNSNSKIWELKINGLGAVVASDMKVSSFDENKIYISTFNNGIFKSTDGGNSWTNISQTLGGFQSRVIEINPNNDDDIFIGTNHGIWESKNAGISWDSLNFSGLKSFTINDIAISPKGDIFIAETGGSIQYIPGLITAIEDSKISIPNNFELEQNYPNPFNPTTVIKYFIPVKRRGSSLYNVILKIYDVLGKEVATLVNEEKPAGSYQINFNAQILSSGIYFYRLSAISKTTNFVQTKKMILLR